MFGSIGGPELVLILVVALLIFGPRKLPELGKTLGKGLAEFRRAANELKDSLEVEVARDAASTRHTPQAPQTESPEPNAAHSAAPAETVHAADAPATEAAGAHDEQQPNQPS